MSDHPAESLPLLRLEITHKGVVRLVELQQPLIEIGRKSTCHVAVEDDLTMSRLQAQVRWQGKNYWINDGALSGMASLTGTYFNGERIAQGDRMPLASGVKLKFGETTATVRIERPNQYQAFDAFLCHSNSDKPQVRHIARELRKAGLNPWLDEDELAATAGFIATMSYALRVVGTAAVIWGPNSPGKWQQREIEFLQKAEIEEGVRLIPVVLEGVERDPDWPVFMDLLQRIDFRRPHQDPIAHLIAAIRSDRRKVGSDCRGDLPG